MVMLNGKEFALKDLPMICFCGDWKCFNSYHGREGILEELIETIGDDNGTGI